MADNPQSFSALFPWKPGDPVLGGLRDLMNVLDALLLPAVTAKTDYEQTINELRATILTRFNESIQPIFDEITSVASLGAIFTATSSSIYPVSLGTKSFILDPGARNTFAASPYLAIVSRSNPALAMTGTTTFYDRITGQLIVNVTATSGTAGTAADWDIAAAPPPFVPAALDAGVIEQPDSTPKQNVRFRRSHVAGAVPSVAEFQTNTFVLNDADGMLYFLGPDNASILALPIEPGLRLNDAVITAKDNLNLGNSLAEFITVTGSATITSFGNTPLQKKFVRFTADCNITYNSGSLILPTAASLIVKAGDSLFATSDINGNWVVQNYTRLTGEPLAYAADIVRAGQAQTFTPTQKRQAKQNLGAVGAGIANFSANANLTAAHVGFMLVALATCTLTLPQGSSLAASDRLSFSNVSAGNLSIAVNGNDTSARIYGRAGTTYTSITVPPGGFVDLTWDGGNWYAQGLGIPDLRTPLFADVAQALSTGQIQQVFQNLGLGYESTIASAGTVDLGSVNTDRVIITGSNTISSFGTAANKTRFVTLTGSAQINHNSASLVLPNAANIAGQAGDTFIATSDGAGNWRVRSYQRGDGTPLAGGARNNSAFWLKLQSGIIIQGSSVVITTDAGGNASQAFYTAFPNVCIGQVMSNGDKGNGAIGMMGTPSGWRSNTNFAVNITRPDDSAYTGTVFRVNYLAFGY